MSGVNKVILVGNLGQDPEGRALPNGTSVTSLSIATSERWTDKQTGEKKEKTEWHRVVLFGRIAEVANEHLTKGSTVYLEGKLQTRKWTDKEGTDRYTTEIVANTLQFLNTKSREGDGGGQQSATAPAKASQASKGEPDFDDDIPF